MGVGDGCWGGGGDICVCVSGIHELILHKPPPALSLCMTQCGGYGGLFFPELFGQHDHGGWWHDLGQTSGAERLGR